MGEVWKRSLKSKIQHFNNFHIIIIHSSIHFRLATAYQNIIYPTRSNRIQRCIDQTTKANDPTKGAEVAAGSNPPPNLFTIRRSPQKFKFSPINTSCCPSVPLTPPTIVSTKSSSKMVIIPKSKTRLQEKKVVYSEQEIFNHPIWKRLPKLACRGGS